VDAKIVRPPLEPYFLTSCLGATHALGGLRPTLARLREWTRPGGWIVVGDGFWKRPPGPEYLRVLNATPGELLTDPGNAAVGEELGLRLGGQWSSSAEEWDAFEDAYSDGIESYAQASPDDLDVPEMLVRIRTWRHGYLTRGRETLGFGIYAFRVDP